MKRLIVLVCFIFVICSSMILAVTEHDERISLVMGNGEQFTSDTVVLTVPEFSHVGIAAAVAVGIAGVYAARKRQQKE